MKQHHMSTSYRHPSAHGASEDEGKGAKSHLPPLLNHHVSIIDYHRDRVTLHHQAIYGTPNPVSSKRLHTTIRKIPQHLPPELDYLRYPISSRSHT